MAKKRKTDRPWDGRARPPKAKRYGETSTPTTSSYYEGMQRYFRWFRQDSFTRKCIITNAYFATMAAGFEIVLNEDETPGRLIILQSDRLKPNVSEDWELTGFRYEGRDSFYQP